MASHFAHAGQPWWVTADGEGWGDNEDGQSRSLMAYQNSDVPSYEARMGAYMAVSS